MSLFGSLMGDFDDDMGFMGNHMNAMNMQMRSMNRLMNSFMPDPFNMFNAFDNGFQSNALMERGGPGMHMGGLFGFPAMPNMNRLLNADIGAPNGASFCSSSVVTMSSGPDGRPQIYQATQSTKTGPGGVRETRKTVQDSTTGVKKMAIGHHIGERAHIIEKEQDLRSGQLEERQEFINLDEDEAEDFDREFVTKANRNRNGSAIRGAPQREVLTIEPLDDDEDDEYARPSRRQMPALQAPPSQHQSNNSSAAATTTATAASVKTSDVNTEKKSKSKTTSTSSSATSIATQNHNNNNNNYLTASPRRSSYRSHHLTGTVSNSSVTPRRPLRTPSSSPLATTPTVHSHSTIATSPSVHPHPYNVSAARRHHQHRPAKNSNKQKEAQPDLDGIITVSAQKTGSKSKHSIKTSNNNNDN